MLRTVGEFVAAVLAVFAAFLPVRYWERFRRLPVERAVTLSAWLGTVAGALAGGIGFIQYSRHAADLANRGMLTLAERQLRGEFDQSVPITTAAPNFIGSLSLLAFTFFTPLGLASLYIVVSGIARAGSNIAGSPMGDPVLTLVDSTVRRIRSRSAAKRALRDREAREGPEVPDRLYPGRWAGLPDWDFVVVSSRRKDGWTRGTFVLTRERWYTIGDPFDMELQVGLRTVYPLKAHTVTEVLRRGVPYELPPLQEVRGGRAGPQAR